MLLFSTRLRSASVAAFLALAGCSAASDGTASGPQSDQNSNSPSSSGSATGGGPSSSGNNAVLTGKNTGSAQPGCGSGEFACVDAGKITDDAAESLPDVSVPKPKATPEVPKDAASEKVCHLVQGQQGNGASPDGSMWCEGSSSGGGGTPWIPGGFTPPGH